MIDTVKNIYSHLCDDMSRNIFKNRLMYSITNDPAYIRNIVEILPEGKEFIKKLNSGKNNYFFGAGAWGKEFAQILSDKYTIKGIFDNNIEIQGTEICGLKVLKPSEELLENAQVFITTMLHYESICEQLNSFKNSFDIYNTGKIMDELADSQYFDLDELPHDENETFVDVGCLDGKTTLEFVKWAGDYRHIYCFEADEKSICRINENLKNADNITVINKGAWDRNGKIGFLSRGDGASKVDENVENSISVTTLDSALADKKVTYIKMDIEGSEKRALIGSKEIIKTQKPKLAICVYHKPEDIIELPELILKYNNDYKFYLRHYGLARSETVLYAI